MKRTIAYGVFALIILGGAAFFFFAPSYAQLNGAERSDVASDQQAAVLPVASVTATLGSLQNYLRLNGDVQAASTVDVMPDVSGKLVSNAVRAGQYVSRDQVLGSVDSSRPGTSFIASPVKAPISGTVTRVLGTVGASVSPSVPLFQISQLSSLEIIAQVPERYIRQVKQGQSVYVRSSAFPSRVVLARVAEVSPVVDSRSRSMEITIALSRDIELFKAGMFVDLSIVTQSIENAVVIPEQTILQRNGGNSVFVIDDDDTVSLQGIEIGLTVDGYVQVVSGLSGGETLVYSGQSLLSDGSTVEQVNVEQPADPAGNLHELIQAVAR